MKLVVILMLILAATCLATISEPVRFTQVKEMYTVFIDYMKKHNTDPRFEVLKTRCVLVGFDRKNGELGYNTNKGYEIGLCLDGTPNQIFHVLLHELAHCTVPEYDHSPQFWKNFRDLKDICSQAGIYEMIPHKVNFCGQQIQDL